MASVSRFRFFRTCSAFFFVGAALFVGGYGVLLLVEAFDDMEALEGTSF